MFKIVRSRVYAETVQARQKAESELRQLTEKSVRRENYIKALEKQNADCNEKLQAMRQASDAAKSFSKHRERKIEELETELKMLKIALDKSNELLGKKSAEVIELTTKNSGLNAKLKQSLTPAIPTDEIPSAMKAVEMPAVEKPKRKYNRSGKYRGKNNNRK